MLSCFLWSWCDLVLLVIWCFGTLVLFAIWCFWCFDTLVFWSFGAICDSVFLVIWCFGPVCDSVLWYFGSWMLWCIDDLVLWCFSAFCNLMLLVIYFVAMVLWNKQSTVTEKSRIAVLTEETTSESSFIISISSCFEPYSSGLPAIWFLEGKNTANRAHSSFSFLLYLQFFFYRAVRTSGSMTQILSVIDRDSTDSWLSIAP